MEHIKVGSWTNQGMVLFIDNVSESVPDPLCKVSSTMMCSHRLSELFLVDKPQEIIEKEMKKKELMKQKHRLLKELSEIEKQLE